MPPKPLDWLPKAAGLQIYGKLVVIHSTSKQEMEGVEFPSFVEVEGSGQQQLVGAGLRKKSLLGIKSITIYAFGVYANPQSLYEKLDECFDKESAADDIKKKDDLLEAAAAGEDVEMTVRLVIVYGSLKMTSVRSAFDESLGGRIKKFTGAEDKQLLQSFTNLLKDDFQLRKGTTIDMSRLPGGVLKMTIDGQEVGSVQSGLLCHCLLDLYIGEEPFDKAARQAIGDGLIMMLLSSPKEVNEPQQS